MSALTERIKSTLNDMRLQMRADRETVKDHGAFSDEEKQVACKSCGKKFSKVEWRNHYYACPNCGKLRSIGGYYRLSLIFDEGTFREFDQDLTVTDPLHFNGYGAKAAETEKKTGLKEAVISGDGLIDGIHTVAVVLDSRFFMGSMSHTVGEKVTRAIERATREHLPLIIFSASGGARMQEGIYSLMQMAKTSAAIAEFSASGGLYISYLTHPTTGGVTASFASLGDITLAEEGALIGFAGPRVIRQTLGVELPAGFQRAEYLEKHGFVDRIVPRKDMKQTLADILRLHVDSMENASRRVVS